MRLSTAAALSIILAAAACGQTQDSDFCCDVQPKCKNVSTMNITMKQFAETSPHYEPILSCDEYSVYYKCVCITYFPISDNKFLEFRAIQGATLTISVFIVADLRPGVFRAQGLYDENFTTVHDDYVVDASCQSCQPLYIYYKCYLYDKCDFVDTGYDDVNGRSSSVDNDPSCLDAFESLVTSEGLNVHGFTRPAGPSCSCVAYFGNSTCINYQRIAPSNRISYPMDGS